MSRRGRKRRRKRTNKDRRGGNAKRRGGMRTETWEGEERMNERKEGTRKGDVEQGEDVKNKK